MKAIILSIVLVFSSSFLLKEFKSPWDDYDIYVFALQWAATLCKSKGTKCYEKLKVIPPHHMTIHGLWPSYSSGKSIADCNTGATIDVIDDGDSTFLEARKYWPSLTGENKDFWNHEYNKHGYCVNKRFEQDVNNYKFYMQKAIDLHYKNSFNTLIIDLAGDSEDGEYVLPDEFFDLSKQTTPDELPISGDQGNKY